jgi:hypothetical protein
MTRSEPECAIRAEIDGEESIVSPTLGGKFRRFPILAPICRPLEAAAK